MAEQINDTGEVISIDHDDNAVRIARTFWEKSNHGKKCKAIIGTAIDVIKEINGPFDFIFIDADKENYINYLEKCIPMLSDKGIIVADNTLWYGKVINKKINDPDAIAIREFNKYVKDRMDLKNSIIPIRDGLTIISLI
jgi:predicted O-methyltransferase YrrM